MHTEKDVLSFLIKVDRGFKSYDIFDVTSRQAATRLGEYKFFKTDIDKNNLTDLVINGSKLVIILDNGKDYKIHYLDQDPLDKVTLLNIDTATELRKIIRFIKVSEE